MMKGKGFLTKAGLLALGTYVCAIRPWQAHWGAFLTEIDKYLPGDDLVPTPKTTSTRALTIHAPAAEVWPWLVQIGQGRGGFYSYDWLENLFGLDIYSADHIIPEAQTLAVGEIVPLAPQGGPAMMVAEIEPERALVLRDVYPDTHRPVERTHKSYWDFSWAFILEPIDEARTRLIIRGRGDTNSAMLNGLSFMIEPIQFLMERKMMLGIKARAEQARASQDIASIMQSTTLLDEVLPEAEFKDAHSITIHASREQIVRAFQSVTPAEMPIAQWLGDLRYLPGRIAGNLSEETDIHRPFLDLVLKSGNIKLAERPNQEYVIGAIGKLHQITDQEFVPLADTEAFMNFAEPDYQKLAQSIRIAGGDSVTGYKVIFEHRTHSLSATARRNFSLYWLVIKPSSAFLVKMLLAAIKRRAEAMVREEAAVEEPPDEVTAAWIEYA